MNGRRSEERSSGATRKGSSQSGCFRNRAVKAFSGGGCAYEAAAQSRLDPVSQAAYVRAVRESLRASGFEGRELDLLGANTMKPSMWARILRDLELDPATQIYDEESGHVAFLDQFLRIRQVREERRLPQGGVLVLTTGGVGFH